MVRTMLGQGLRMMRNPSSFGRTGLPERSTTSADDAGQRQRAGARFQRARLRASERS